MSEELETPDSEEDLQQDKESSEYLKVATSTTENILRAMIAYYKEGYNQHNPKYEIDYYLTLTHHKIETPVGKKDVAYLRLERAIRSKVVQAEVEDPKATGLVVPEWSTQLVHQEMHSFRNIQERLNPNAPWKESLYLSCLFRLAGAGLEYAELLQRMKAANLNDLREQEEKAREMAEPSIVVTDKMPTPLTPAEENYLKEIKEMRKAEGV